MGRERYKYSYKKEKNELKSHSGLEVSQLRGQDLIRLSSSLPLTIANKPEAPQVSMYDEYKNPDKITLRMEIGSKSLSFPYSIPALFQRDMNTTQTIVGRIYCDSTQHQHIRFFSAAL